MFDLLRKKISNFIGNLTQKEEQKPAETAPPTPEPTPEPVPSIKPQEATSRLTQLPPTLTEKPSPPPTVTRKPTPPLTVTERPTPPLTVAEKPTPPPTVAARPALQPRLSLLSKVKALVSSEVEIAERDVAPLLEELELALLESDVSQDTAQFLAQDLRARLAGKRVPKGRVGEEVRAEVSRALADVFAPPFDLAQKIREKRAKGEPLVVLFVGPNGTGKTTLVAKIAHQLKAQELKGVIAAADTFRKGALEQAQEHGRRTGVPVISRGYGADPTSVAFDAVQHAKANGLDVVLVDTAGRQETSTNLVREMEKMNRVLRPDLKVFVGEAIAGHALVEQVKKFHEAIRLDGIALTKLDCDAKGGGALSIAYETRLPLLYLGTGQEYGDLVPFDREWLVHRIAG